MSNDSAAGFETASDWMPCTVAWSDLLNDPTRPRDEWLSCPRWRGIDSDQDFGRSYRHTDTGEAQ